MDEGGASELQVELTEAQKEASATKEELNSCRERLEKLQELLQVQALKMFFSSHTSLLIFCVMYDLNKFLLH